MPRKKKRDQDGIHQRPDSPYWWATIPNGRGGSTRRSTRVSIAEDPQGLKAKAVRAGWVADGLPEPPVNGVSFDDLMLAYLGQVTPTKRDTERDHASAKALYPVFSGKALADIGAAEVRGYIAIRTQAGRAPGTINKEIGLMSAALNWAKRELEWDVVNPWCQRKLKEPAGRDRWLTQEEADLLLKASRKASRAPHLADFIRLGLNTGLRLREMLGLDWSRVDLDSRLVYLGADNQKNGRTGSVPLNEEANEALLSRARFRAKYCSESPWVFCTKKGVRIASVKTGFNLAVERAGLENVHTHDLRRTFGSWLVQAGVDIRRVSELLRHSDISITARVYAHLSPKDLAEAVEVLDRTFDRAAVSR